MKDVTFLSSTARFEPRAAPRDRPAILVVDDTPANLVAMKALLSSLDIDVAVAPSGEDALRALLQRDFAIVLMDIQMPGLDGFKTTELMRQVERTRHTPIIFVTAIFTDDASEKRAYSLGAIDFITKPFDETTLKAKVAALVDHHRQRFVIERQAERLREKQREADLANAARAAAEAANRAKDDFLAMLSHELRAPLNSVLGSASLLGEHPRLAPELTKYVDTITRAARAQSKLIDELLDVSAIVAGKLRIEKSVIDVELIVRSAIASASPAANQKSIRLELSVAPETFATLGDARRLEQLVTHLLANAVKFSGPGGVVDVALLRRDHDIVLRVKDVGIGISAELLPHIFERFRQADSSHTRREGGLGIGLTVARAIAESHGGTLDGFSGGLGSGAEFIWTLPAATEDAIASSAAASHDDSRPIDVATSRPGDSKPLLDRRLLVVDDDEDAREILAEMLQSAGAAVVTAASAADAVAAFESDSFDVLITDIGMPDESGLSLLGRIRALDAARGGRLVAVAVSGYGTPDDRAASRRAGFHAHVVKPCDGAKLIALLARVMEPSEQ